MRDRLLKSLTRNLLTYAAHIVMKDLNLSRQPENYLDSPSFYSSNMDNGKEDFDRLQATYHSKRLERLGWLCGLCTLPTRCIRLLSFLDLQDRPRGTTFTVGILHVCISW